MANIGFVGLGHMGLPMAVHLIQSGNIVTGFDVKPQALDALVHAGGLSASSLPEVAQGQDVLITMLQTGEQVMQVCLGDNGLFASAKASSLLIDCSSIDVPTSRSLHQKARHYGLQVVDAPVSGGVAGAVAATLTFMVGGSEANFLLAQPILIQMGKKIIYAGDPGSGQAAKICNNMILGIAMIAVSEAFLLARYLGLSEKKLQEVVTHSSGQCWVMSHYVPVPNVLETVPANHDYQPGFTAAMMLKDLRLSQQPAETAGISTPLGNHAMELYRQLSDRGMGELDFSAIINELS